MKFYITSRSGSHGMAKYADEPVGENSYNFGFVVTLPGGLQEVIEILSQEFRFEIVAPGAKSEDTQDRFSGHPTLYGIHFHDGYD